MRVSSFGFATVPNLVDAHVTANGARRPITLAREQKPYQEKQEE